MLKKIINKIFLAISCFIIIVALILSLLRIAVDFSNIEKPWFERVLSHYIHHPVVIGRVDTDWLAWSPSIRIHNLKVFQNTENTQLLAGFKQIDVGLALIEWVKYHSLILVKVSASSGSLNINQKTSQFLSLQKVNDQSTFQDNVKFVIWLAGHSYISLSHIAIKLNGQSHRVIHGMINNLQTYHYKKNRMIIGRVGINNNKQSIRIIGTIPLSNLLNSQMKWYFHINNFPIYLLEKYSSMHLPQGGELKNGFISSDVWLNFINGKVTLLKSHSDIKKIALKTDSHMKNSLYIADLKFNTQWQRMTNGWGINLSHVLFDNHRLLTDSFLNLFYNNMGAGSESFLINIPKLSLHDIYYLEKPVINLQLPVKLRDVFKHVYLNGNIHDLRLKIQQKNNHESGLTGSFDFNHISFQPVGNIPAILNLSGSLVLNKKQGQVHLSSHDSLVMAKSMTEKNLPISDMQGNIYWKKMSDKTIIRTDDFNLRDHNYDISINPSVITKDINGIYIDSYLSYKLNSLNNIVSMIPGSRLKPKLVSWLGKAFNNKGAIDGALIWRGYLKDYPYKKNQGYFESISSLKGVDLHFNKKWPSIQNINGDMEFINNKLNVDINTAHMKNIPLKNIKATMANLKKPHLIIAGQTELALNDALANLKYLPIGLDKEFKGFSGSGMMKVDLDLDLPFRNHFKNKSYHGNITFNNSSLVLPWFGIPINSIVGKIHIQNGLISSNNITASLFNNVGQFNISTNKSTKAQKITIKSVVPINQIQQYFGWSFLNNIAGKTPYHAILILQHNKQLQSSLAVFSSLHGVRSHYPQPLTKSASSNIPFELYMSFATAKNNVSDLKFKLGSKLNARMLFNKKNNTFTMSRGVLASGNINAKLPQTKGLNIDIITKKFNWNKWLDCIRGLSNQSKDSIVHKVYIQTPLLIMYGQKIRTAYVDAENLDPNWKIRINSENVVGSVVAYFDRPTPYYLANFTRLYLAKTKIKKSKKNEWC